MQFFQLISGLYFSRKGIPKMSSFLASWVTRALISQVFPLISELILTWYQTVASGFELLSAYQRVIGSSSRMGVALMSRAYHLLMKFSWAPESIRAVTV